MKEKKNFLPRPRYYSPNDSHAGPLTAEFLTETQGPLPAVTLSEGRTRPSRGRPRRVAVGHTLLDRLLRCTV